jgi:phenylacetate-CoA ligase
MSRDINNKFWNEELETLPREELEKRQLEDLKEIVKFAYDNAPYYRRSFDEAGVKPEDIKTLKDIEKFPEDLQIRQVPWSEWRRDER